MILGIFRRNNIFIDEIVLFPCQHKIREKYPIREKHNKFAILVMELATTFTVRLAYRHYRNTRLVQSVLVNAYMYVLLFCCKTPRSPWLMLTRFISSFFFHFVLRFKVQVPYSITNTIMRNQRNLKQQTNNYQKSSVI